MPVYTFVAKDKNGKSIESSIDAADKITASEQLQRQGYFVISIKDNASVNMSARRTNLPKHRHQKFLRKKIKLADIITFARQIATMLEAGVSLMRGLEVIQSQIESEKLAQVIQRVKTDVEKGHSFSQALGRHPKVFNQFWVSLVEVGEASGTLPMVLNKLTFYLEQQQSFRSTVVSSIIYPAILFLVSVGAISFFALFVGPKFESIFKSMGSQLPFVTVALLTSFRFIRENFLLITGIFVAVIIFIKQYIKTPMGKEQFEKFLFSLPSVGNVFRLIIVERFAGQMAILIDAGVPILAALDIAEKLVDNSTCAKIVRSVKEGVKRGELLVTPMERSGFFPGMCIQLITVGEETGELSKMMKHVSKYYQETVETFIKRLSTLIEPFMIIFMGAIIGVIVIAMFLPLFNMAQIGGGGGS